MSPTLKQILLSVAILTMLSLLPEAYREAVEYNDSHYTEGIGK